MYAVLCCVVLKLCCLSFNFCSLKVVHFILNISSQLLAIFFAHFSVMLLSNETTRVSSSLREMLPSVVRHPVGPVHNYTNVLSSER